MMPPFLPVSLHPYSASLGESLSFDASVSSCVEQEITLPPLTFPYRSVTRKLSEKTEGQGCVLPEPIFVALTQVAGTSVLTGVLDTSVDGYGAVLALRNRWGEKYLVSVASDGRYDPGDPRDFPAASGMKPRRK